MKTGAFFVILAGTLACGQDPARVLTGSEKTAHFEIRFRPGSPAEASVDRVAVVAEADLRKILEELALPDFKHVIRLFLYDGVEELQKITGQQVSGWSSTLQSHVPHDNDQTRLHELVHVVAEKFPEPAGPEPRNLFYAEGLANAVLRFVNGVPVDAVAAFYKKRGELPPLAEIHAVQDFYAWMAKRPRFNAYDVGGSYFRYLLDTYGALKTRKYYRGAPAREAFGADLVAVEKGWHARLDKVVLRAGLEALLLERAGVTSASPEAKLTDAVLGPASEWKSLDRTEVLAGDPGSWDGKTDALALSVSGSPTQGDWTVARLAGEPVGDAIVKGRVHATGGSFGVQIQIGPECQALLLKGQGAFIYDRGRVVAHDPSATLGDQPAEIVLRRRGGRASVWIDGKLAVEGDVPREKSVLGFGSVGGPARFAAIAVRRLDGKR